MNNLVQSIRRDRIEQGIKKRYEDVYLLRNEKSFQLYRFTDGKAFEPDFVLFLKEKKTNETLVYQLFIEPKGEGYMEGDIWKEEFLKDYEQVLRAWRKCRFRPAISHRLEYLSSVQ